MVNGQTISDLQSMVHEPQANCELLRRIQNLNSKLYNIMKPAHAIFIYSISSKSKFVVGYINIPKQKS
jgi:flagellar biosynthesis/type III secretory pathway chaperone